MTDSAQGLQTRVNGLLDTDPRTLIPDASALQQRAFTGADGLGGWRAGNSAAQGAATGLLDAPLTPSQAAARSLLDVDLEAYANPELEHVVGTSLAGFDEQAGMRRAALAAEQARGAKFSGSGSAIAKSLFERGNIQDRAGTEAGLRAAAYDRAAGLATGDLNREAQTSQFNAGQANSLATAEREAQLHAAGLLGDLSNNGAANDRADLGVLSDLGGQERGIDREKLGANTELLKLIAALNGQQPYQLFHGGDVASTGTSTTKSKDYGLGNAIGVYGDFLAGAGEAAKGAASMGLSFSDKRLKTAIHKEGRDHAGRPVVSYRYKGEPKDVRRLGYLAQDIEKTDPEAVVRGPGGYRMLDYGLLGEAA